MDAAQRELARLLRAVREGFAHGENVMALVRDALGQEHNESTASLLAYDLQAGRYNAWAGSHPGDWDRWTRQVAAQLLPHLSSGGSILEVGCGEATTLAGVLRDLGGPVGPAYGFDISWSRIHEARAWLQHWGQAARLFVADLFHIPLADNSVDVVYSVHSLEPNGGREEEAIQECLRVARIALVLIEPMFELGSPAQQKRMQSLGYVRGLKATAMRMGAQIVTYRLLDYSINPMNPSGVLAIQKSGVEKASQKPRGLWKCPLTSAPLMDANDVFFVPTHGLVYPVLRGVPMLRAEHAIVASKLQPG